MGARFACLVRHVTSAGLRANDRHGSVGVAPKHIGYFVIELYFYSEDQMIKDVVLGIDWKEEVNSISGKRLPKGLALEIINNKLLKGET